MPNYQVAIRLLDQKLIQVTVPAPSYDEAGEEALRSLRIKDLKGAIVESIDRSGAGMFQKHDKHESNE
jgi:tartrate dehydratase beta subunit/fumarate hydratase class I family protein